MSSHIRIQKTCQHCKKVFTARTTVTRFCSDDCAKRNYKKRMREEKLQAAKADASEQAQEHLLSLAEATTATEKEFVDIRQLSLLVGLSERTLFRLIQSEDFPKLKVGRRLLFQKAKVIAYLNAKYGSV